MGIIKFVFGNASSIYEFGIYDSATSTSYTI